MDAMNIDVGAQDNGLEMDIDTEARDNGSWMDTDDSLEHDKKAQKEENQAETSGAICVPDISDGMKLEGINTSKDLLTGETSKYIVSGTKAYAEMIERYDKMHSIDSDPKTKEKRRKELLEYLINNYMIWVPANKEQIENKNILKERIDLGDGNGEVLCIKTNPNFEDKFHLELLYRQHNVMYHSPEKSSNGKKKSVSQLEASGNSEMIFFEISNDELIEKFNVKNPNKLKITMEEMGESTSFFSLEIHSVMRESLLIPILVKTSWLMFIFSSYPRPLVENSFNIISEMMVIFKKLLCEPRVQQASTKTKKWCDDIINNRFDENIYMLHPYLKHETSYIMKYIKEYQTHGTTRKKKRIINNKYTMTPACVCSWAFFYRAKSRRDAKLDFFTAVVQLAIARGKQKRMKEVFGIDTREIDVTKKDNINEYIVLIEKNKTDQYFLRDLFKLHCVYTQSYMHIFETFLLTLLMDKIPCNKWEYITSDPIVNPKFALNDYTNEVHYSLCSSINALTTKMKDGEANEIKMITNKLQIERIKRMHHLDPKKNIPICDDSSKIYNIANVVPTFFQMKVFCEWILFSFGEMKIKNEMEELKKLYDHNFKMKINHAIENGQKVIIHENDTTEHEYKQGVIELD